MKHLLFLAIIASIATQSQAMDSIRKETVRDFAMGAGIGTVHGLFNKNFAPNPLQIQGGYPDLARIDIKLIPSGIQLLSFYAANQIEDTIISNNGGPYYYWHHRPVAEKLGHALAQGFVEGSTYDNSTKTFKPGFALNLTLFVAAYDYLWTKQRKSQGDM